MLIEKKFGRPIVCDDGVTIAKEVELKDPEENLGAQMVREAAERTGDAVGDGTTTSTLLAHAILAEGVRNVAAGASAVDLKRGLTRGLKVAIESIRALSRPVTSKREKAQVATISAHNNSIVGDMVAEAVEKVGAEGAITVLKNPRPPRRYSKLSKACSLTAALFLRILLPIPKAWKQPSTSRSS